MSRPESDPDPEDKPELSERVAQTCIIVAGVALLITFAGLAALAADLYPYGRMLLTGGLGAASASLIVVTVATAWGEDEQATDIHEDEDGFESL